MIRGLFTSSLLLFITVFPDLLTAQDDQLIQCKAPEYFICRNGNCLPNGYVCDGDDDCGDGSDELKSMCSTIKCQSNEFQCRSGRCVPGEAKCDRQPHCRDGSDEEGCVYPPCPDGQFACANNTQCLNMEEVCDGTIDCKDGLASDELHPSPCSPNVTCPDFAFKCKSTNVCALPHWLCDGENDCADYSDEDIETCKNRPCPDGYFRCRDHRCIPESALCNGVIDCRDGYASDERQPSPCPKNATCPDGFFSCEETTICAYPYSMCDENNDCGDGSDEIKKNCESLTCPEGWFRCKSDRCIPPNWRCDGGKDCPDFEDEINCEEARDNLTTTKPPTSTRPTSNSISNNNMKSNQRTVGVQTLRKPGH